MRRRGVQIPAYSAKRGEGFAEGHSVSPPLADRALSGGRFVDPTVNPPMFPCYEEGAFHEPFGGVAFPIIKDLEEGRADRWVSLIGYNDCWFSKGVFFHSWKEHEGRIYNFCGGRAESR